MLADRIYMGMAIASVVAVIGLSIYYDRMSRPGPLDRAPEFFVEALEAYERWDKTCAQPSDSRSAGVKGGIRLFREDALGCAFKWAMGDRDWATLEETEQVKIAPLIAGLYIMTREEKWKRYDICLMRESTRIYLSRPPIEDINNDVLLAVWMENIGRPLPEDLYEVRSDFFKCACDYDLACRLARSEN